MPWVGKSTSPPYHLLEYIPGVSVYTSNTRTEQPYPSSISRKVNVILGNDLSSPLCVPVLFAPVVACEARIGDTTIIRFEMDCLGKIYQRAQAPQFNCYGRNPDPLTEPSVAVPSSTEHNTTTKHRLLVLRVVSTSSRDTIEASAVSRLQLRFHLYAN